MTHPIKCDTVGFQSCCPSSYRDGDDQEDQPELMNDFMVGGFGRAAHGFAGSAVPVPVPVPISVLDYVL